MTQSGSPHHGQWADEQARLSNSSRGRPCRGRILLRAAAGDQSVSIKDDDSGTFEVPTGATDMQQVLIALAGGRAEKQREGSKRDEGCALTIIHTRFYRRLIAREQPYFDVLCK
jgi:hypothetical protein